jgi:hypothetical protein
LNPVRVWVKLIIYRFGMILIPTVKQPIRQDTPGSLFINNQIP